MMKYLYKFGLNYITPVIRIQLSYNRLYRVPKFRTPKNEINDIHWGIIILVFSEILIQMVIPFFVYARLWHPAPKNLVGISEQFKIPVKYIGLGEGIEDMQVFRKKEFVDSLFGETE